MLATQSSCAEAASFDLPAEVLGACIAELQRALEMALVKSQDNHSAAVFAEGASIPLRSLSRCFRGSACGPNLSCMLTDRP